MMLKEATKDTTSRNGHMDSEVKYGIYSKCSKYYGFGSEVGDAQVVVLLRTG